MSPALAFQYFLWMLIVITKGGNLLGDDRHKTQRDVAVLLGIIILQLWKVANAIFWFAQNDRII
jgi:hypothetical protein